MSAAPPSPAPRPEPPSESRPRPAGWWSLRWGLARAGAPDVRAWALAELVCALLTLATLAVALGALGVAALSLRHLVPIPGWVTSWPMQILLAGAVGYGTNFLAVQMLFKPREPIRSWPLRVVWSQGLVPARQAEMARIVGEEVAGRLLTPEAIVEETATLIEAAFDDQATVRRVQDAVLPLLRRELPIFLRRFLPEGVEAVREALREGVPAEALRALLLDVFDEWFDAPENRRVLARFLLSFLRDNSPELVDLVRLAVKRYKKKSQVRSLLFGAGEVANVINWDAFEAALRKQFESQKSEEWAVRLITDFSRDARLFADRVITTEWLESVRERAGDMALETLMRVADEALLPRLVALLEREPFRRYLIDELLPAGRARVLSWVRSGTLDDVVGRFDVKGRVARAAAALPVEDLEEMTNRVGAYHLGAIQVLGYVLGLGAGLLVAGLSWIRAA